jgi:hypothetical protein
MLKWEETSTSQPVNHLIVSVTYIRNLHTYSNYYYSIPRLASLLYRRPSPLGLEIGPARTGRANIFDGPVELSTIHYLVFHKYPHYPTTTTVSNTRPLSTLPHTIAAKATRRQSGTRCGSTNIPLDHSLVFVTNTHHPLRSSKQILASGYCKHSPTVLGYETDFVHRCPSRPLSQIHVTYYDYRAQKAWTHNEARLCLKIVTNARDTKLFQYTNILSTITEALRHTCYSDPPTYLADGRRL